MDKMFAWYEGPDMEIGQEFNPEDIVVILVSDDKWESSRRLSYLLDGYTFNDNIIREQGWNMFQAIYRKDGIKYQQWFCVHSLEPDSYPEKEFNVIYQDPRLKDIWVDMTELFRPKFTFDGRFVISWKQFSLEVSELMLYGIYMMTAPPGVGLSARFTEEWEVRCNDALTLKARVFKTYHEEEDLSWHQERKIMTLKEWQEWNLQQAFPKS